MKGAARNGDTLLSKSIATQEAAGIHKAEGAVSLAIGVQSALQQAHVVDSIYYYVYQGLMSN